MGQEEKRKWEFGHNGSEGFLSNEFMRNPATKKHTLHCKIRKPSHVTSTFEFVVILNRFVLGTKTHRCRCPSCRSSPAPCRCRNRARTIRTRTCTPTPSSCWSCTARGRCSCSGSPPGYSACRSNLKQRRISADAAERKSS